MLYLGEDPWNPRTRRPGVMGGGGGGGLGRPKDLGPLLLQNDAMRYDGDDGVWNRTNWYLEVSSRNKYK